MALKREYNKDIDYYIIIINKARGAKHTTKQKFTTTENLFGQPTLLTCMANQLNSTQLKLRFPLWSLRMQKT